MHINNLTESLRGHDGFFYLATPYTKYPRGHYAAFQDAATLAGELLKRGVHVFCPIAHSHPIALSSGVDHVDHDLWMGIDERMMKGAKGLIVADMEGWAESRGVSAEIAFFKHHDKPVYLLSDTAELLGELEDEVAPTRWPFPNFGNSNPFAIMKQREHNKLLSEITDRLMETGPVRIEFVDLSDEPSIETVIGSMLDELAKNEQGAEDACRSTDAFMEGEDEYADATPYTGYPEPDKRGIYQDGPLSGVERKKVPLCEGVIDYFPLALMEVARISKLGNDKHNPGEPLHHARGKSMDHADCIARHLVDRGRVDPIEGVRHSAQLAWRALALLQEEMEKVKAAELGVDPEDVMARNARFDNPNRFLSPEEVDAGMKEVRKEVRSAMAEDEVQDQPSNGVTEAMLHGANMGYSSGADAEAQEQVEGRRRTYPLDPFEQIHGRSMHMDHLRSDAEIDAEHRRIRTVFHPEDCSRPFRSGDKPRGIGDVPLNDMV